MNWKNVLRLVSVDVKAYRQVSGPRFRRFRENRLLMYGLYIGACLLGVAVGWLIGSFYDRVTDPSMKALFLQGAISLFASLPTLVLVFGLIFTMMGQIQRSGMKASIRPLYWFPVTWGEHTLASILANLVGIQLAFMIFIGSGMAVASVFLGQVPLAVFTLLALAASAFLASATTEIFRILQVRLTGAVYRSSGRSAVWVRFISSILFLIVFYVVWFSVTSGAGLITLVEVVAGAQGAIWFVPYVWLGTALSSFIEGLLAETIIFSAASLLFLLALFHMAVVLNSRFGLYEPPAITVSRGVYAPRASLLGSLGFSPLEAAMIKKDFKAFTRRRELMYIFVMPLVFLLMPLLQVMRVGGQAPPPPPQIYPMFAVFLLMSGALMAMMLGTMMIGEEGKSVWYVFSSPITAKSLVRCKYAFVTIFSLAATAVCNIVGVVVIRPSPSVTVATLVESVFLIFALGAVSLGAGIRGADFEELPRPRMIRPLTALGNAIVCFFLALAILSPLIPNAVTAMGSPLSLPKLDLHIALLASGVITAIITYVFYRMTVRKAEEFLIKAEG
ncbi:MAG: ABC-2 transporter permease [Candidatus Bathyarchaeia archaeon]